MMLVAHCIEISIERVARGPVTSVNDMLVVILAAQGPVARLMDVIAWCVAVSRVGGGGGWVLWWIWEEQVWLNWQ